MNDEELLKKAKDEYPIGTVIYDPITGFHKVHSEPRWFSPMNFIIDFGPGSPALFSKGVADTELKEFWKIKINPVHLKLASYEQY